MARVSYLQTIEPRRNKRLEPLPSAAIARVRPDRQRAGLMCDRDRVLYREMLLRHECATGGAEVSRKRLTKIVDHATRDQCARDVRTSDGTAVGLLKDFVYG